jgi:hypothetical protein
MAVLFVMSGTKDFVDKHIFNYGYSNLDKH